MDIIFVSAGAGFSAGLLVGLVLLLAFNERRREPGFLEPRDHWGGV